MKKTLLITLGFVVLAGLTGTIWTLKKQSDDMKLKYAASQASGDSLRTHFDAALVSIAEIQDSLTAILPSESAVLDVSHDIEQSGQLTASRKDQVLRSISDLNSSIQKSKEMIRQMEQNLKDRDVHVASLERVVSNLKKTVADRERMIASLNERVENLQVQVAGLTTDVEVGKQQIAQQEQVIETKRREISTVYYMVSPKKTLKELGVIRESGGVIGFGKSARLSGQFPEGAFSALDTDVQTTIPLTGKKPVVLSGQSSTSYEIIPISEQTSELRIINPEEFRKVRYLVIQAG